MARSVTLLVKENKKILIRKTQKIQMCFVKKQKKVKSKGQDNTLTSDSAGGLPFMQNVFLLYNKKAHNRRQA